MKNIFTFFALLLLTAGVSFAQTTAKTAEQTDLLSLLPKSDAVMTLNVKRLLSEAVPQVLSSKPEMLNMFNAHIDQMKSQTGIDVRQFEQVAAGVKVTKLANGKMQIEPVMAMRGSYNATGLLLIAKSALDGKYRDVKVAGKTVTLFKMNESAKAVAGEAKKVVPTELNFLDEFLNGEIAVTAYDANTLLIGKLPQVTAALTAPKAANNTVNAPLNALINRKSEAVMNLAVSLPAGVTPYFKVDNAQFDKMLGSIRQVLLQADSNDGGMSMMMAAGISQQNEAEEIEAMMLQLQEMGKGFMPVGKGGKDDILPRVIQNTKITRTGSEVQTQLDMSNADLNAVIEMFLTPKKVETKPMPEPTEPSDEPAKAGMMTATPPAKPQTN